MRPKTKPDPSCAICRGACCERFLVPGRVLPLHRPLDLAYFQARGTIEEGDLGTNLVLESRCPKLTPQGCCSIYEERPDTCRQYPRGGPACMVAIRARRTPEEQAAILGGTR